MNLKSNLLVFTLIVLFATPYVFADQPLAALKTVASKDVVAIAWIDLQAVQLKDCIAWASEQGIVDSEAAGEMKAMARMGQGMISEATDAGVDHVFALVHQEDLPLRDPLLIVFSVSDVKQLDKAFQSLQQILALLPQLDFELEVWNGTILAGTKQQIARVKAEPSIERPRLIKAWEKFGGHDAGAMIMGSSDTRRAVHEMFPKLDPPFENITGEVIADDIDSIGLFVGLPNEIDGKLIVQTTNEATAEIMKDAAEAGLGLLVDEEGEFAKLAPPAVRSAISLFKPEVIANELVFDLKPVLTDKVKLLELFEPIAAGSRQSQRQNNLRQIMLAMHNYESANKALPAYANFDDDGKPLLSWRVHILPFLEQSKIYNEFKLDEPWDSPHNIKLVKRMPECYADPSSTFADLNKAGKTRMVVPYAEGTVFHGTEGSTFRSMKDGSSNTIAIVCAAPKSAVVWTKPDDWTVDLDDPKKGLFSKEAVETVVGYADGSSHTYAEDIDKAKLRALLTKDGGEAIP